MVFPEENVIIDLMEFKNITGKIDEVQKRYKEARDKGVDDVLITVNESGTIFTRKETANALAGVIHKKHYKGGKIIVHFYDTDKTYFWKVDDF